VPEADISVVLLQTLHDVVGDEMTLIFGETLAQSPHWLASPDGRKRNRQPQSVPSGSLLCLNIKGTVGNKFAVVN
jgi:hypothetical protein